MISYMIIKSFIIEYIAADRLGYVRNPRSLMEGTEMLCRDDIGDLLGSPKHLWLKRKRQWNWLVDFAYLSHSPCIRV